MLREKRNIFYLKDGTGKVLDFNEDESLNTTEVIEQIEEALQNISGGAVTLELPAKAKGQGKNGGDTTLTKLVYQIALPGGGSDVPGNSAMMGMGNGNNWLFSLLMQQIESSKQLQIQLLEQNNKHQIEKLEQQLKENKGRSKGDLIELFADKVGDKLIQANKLKKAATIASEATTTNKTVAQEAAINSNENTPAHEGKEKIKQGLRNFKEIDPDYIDNLNFLSNYAKENPEAYKLFINSLKGGSNG